MRRLDWQLVRPQADGDVAESLRLVELITRHVQREAAEELDDEGRDFLELLEGRYLDETQPYCEAVGAPTVGDDPHWETRVIDEFADSDVDLELEDYLELRRSEPDCEHCPYASPYSLFPMDPCEFSAGGLELVLSDPQLARRAAAPMTPDEMLSYADALDAELTAERWRDTEVLSGRDYLSKAVLFLRFWAGHGFGVYPMDLDEAIGFTYDASSQAGMVPGDDGEPTTFH